MIIEAGGIPDGTVLEADACIVGAGAAGITLARDLSAAGRRVLLLESGGAEFDPAVNDLNAGEIGGRAYSDLTTCRLRYFGGTTNHWGGWCLPQDPIDFERGWPITRAELDPYYRRAHEVVQIGPFEYDPLRWGVEAKRIPGPFAGPHFVVKMLQNSPPTRFGEAYGPELRRAPNVQAVLNATVMSLPTDPAGTRLEGVEVATLGGTRFIARARAYVLACGGVENARLLLLSGPEAGLGNANGLVGRHFMVHLETPGGLVAVAKPFKDFQFYTNVTSNGRDHAPYGRRFVSYVGLSEATMRTQDLPNMKLFWQFRYTPAMATIRALRGAVAWRGDGHRLADMRAVMSDLGGAGSYAWRWTFGRQALPVEALDLAFTFQPTPNPDSRVRLGDERDALGQRRVVLDWRIDPADRRHARTIARLLGAEVGRTALGRLRTPLEDGDDEQWPEEMMGDQHHMGTTRMSTDPAAGVVDTQCRMHGVENLWVAGSSVFPHAGAANPTLTITALALRLGAHLRGVLA